LTFFVTGAQFLVKKGTPIKNIQSVAGKRIAAQQGSTNAKIIRERVPTAKLLEFPDQPAAFQALAQGQVQAYTNDGVQLAGLRAKAPRPDEWNVVGEFFSYEPYGMVNIGLMDAISSGLYFQLYDKWFGSKGEVPYPLSPETKRFLEMQVVPK
jgi:ABC-type amino acid transport substrate-binding protein